MNIGGYTIAKADIAHGAAHVTAHDRTKAAIRAGYSLKRPFDGKQNMKKPEAETGKM